MSYFKRLPISIRDPLATAKQFSYIQDSKYHPEYYLMSKRMKFDWSNRYYVAEYGGLRLVKEFFTKHGLVGNGEKCSYRTIRRALQGNTKKVFWYLFDVTNARYDGLNARICVFKFILRPILKLGMNDLLQEYIQRFPGDFVYETMIDSYDETMCRALRTLDPVTIKLLFRAGVCVDEYTYDSALRHFNIWARNPEQNFTEEFCSVILKVYNEDPTLDRLCLLEFMQKFQDDKVVPYH